MCFWTFTVFYFKHRFGDRIMDTIQEYYKFVIVINV
jgi:hypothetical protein